jgi:hypothetical protein
VDGNIHLLLAGIFFVRHLIFYFIQVRLDVFFVAVGADSMAEVGFGMGTDITFNLLPVFLVVAYFFAIHANGQ